MNKAPNKQNAVSLFIQVAYIAFFTSFIFSFRAITSISLAAILLGGMIQNWPDRKACIKKLPNQLFLITCGIFYLLQFISLRYTTDTHEGWKHIRLQSGLLFIPLAMYSSYHMSGTIKKRLLSWYCIILVVASLYCLVMAFCNYAEEHTSYVFFYHQLVGPLSQHGVYFSIFVFVALAWLLYTIRKKDFVLTRSFHISLIGFLSLFLLLLSSKMVIAWYAIFLICYFISLFKRHRVHRNWILPLLITFIIAGCTILFTKNPVSQRFGDIFHGDIRFFLKDKFDRADYFNGVQFRLLQWRLVADILTENKSWLTGVGVGDGQYHLDQQYIAKNMYQGDPAKKGSKGYLAYNTHNQLLQSLLQTGLIGALVFLFITITLARMAWKSRNSMYIFVVIVLIVYSLVESVFETQYGILLYTFYPLFMKIRLDKNHSTDTMKTSSERNSSNTYSRLPKR